MKSIFLFGFLSSFLIAAIGEFTQQEALAWAGTIAAIASLLVMSILPLYAKIRDAILKAEIAEREARKEDCHDALRRQKDINSDLTRRVTTLERECTEWQRLYAAGSRDYPKLEGKNE